MCKFHAVYVVSVSEDAEKEKTSAKESFPSDKRAAHDKDRVYASDGGHGDAPRAVRTLLKCRVCA